MWKGVFLNGKLKLHFFALGDGVSMMVIVDDRKRNVDLIAGNCYLTILPQSSSDLYIISSNMFKYVEQMQLALHTVPALADLRGTSVISCYIAKRFSIFSPSQPQKIINTNHILRTRLWASEQVSIDATQLYFFNISKIS